MTTIEVPVQQDAAPSFRGLGIAPNLLTVLDTLKLDSPTPIQLKAIPAAINGEDVIGIAQTGTGKTLAFGIPLLQSIAQNKGHALVLLPTRELALQVYESFANFAKPLGLRGAVLIGGASMGAQISDLRRGPDVIIATPGRLLDHMNQGTVNLSNITFLVLDEADRMLDMGFLPQIREVLKAVPRERQTCLFSATLSREIVEIANKQMRTPLSIQVSPPGTTADKVSQEFFIVRKDEKPRLLEHILARYNGSTIVFSRTKYGATRIMKAVQAMGHTAAEIHSNKSLGQRREALDGFKNGKYRILVATDIAARGIDVKGIELVVNYDVPAASEDYVHRIGRTARAGAKGHAISFAMPDEKGAIRSIERLIRRQIPVTAMPHDLPPMRAVAPQTYEPEQDNRRPSRGRSSSSSSSSFGSRRPSSRPSFGGASRGGSRSGGARRFR